jgi:hypothetical protein
MYLRRMKNSFPFNKRGPLDRAGRLHIVAFQPDAGSLNLQSPTCKGNPAVPAPLARLTAAGL